MSLSKEYLKYILELLFGLDDKTYRLDLDRIDVSYSAIFVCLAATFAALQEGHIIRSQSDEID